MTWPLISLTYTDASGQSRRVAVRKSPFNIGRAPDNDLVIGDSNLAPHHACVEFIAGKPYLSDCGANNGTTLNGRRARGTLELRDGDYIKLGNTHALAGMKGGAVVAAMLNSPLLAGAALGLLLLGSVVGLIWLFVPFEKIEDRRPPVVVKPTPPGLTETPATHANSTGESVDTRPDGGSPTVITPPAAVEPGRATETNKETGAAADEQVRRALRQVLSRISTDNAPYISEEGVNDVVNQVREYRGSAALAERLRAMARGRAEVTALAHANNFKPVLLMYAALAQSEGSGDPVTTARQMTPKLLTLRATFGTGTANQTLLSIASYPYPFNPPIGSQTRTPHPLDSKLKQLGGDGSRVTPSIARSVWFLRANRGITDEAYRLVVRLLAIGVIAQNPRRYGVEAEPLLY